MLHCCTCAAGQAVKATAGVPQACLYVFTSFLGYRSFSASSSLQDTVTITSAVEHGQQHHVSACTGGAAARKAATLSPFVSRRRTLQPLSQVSPQQAGTSGQPRSPGTHARSGTASNRVAEREALQAVAVAHLAVCGIAAAQQNGERENSVSSSKAVVQMSMVSCQGSSSSMLHDVTAKAASQQPIQ